MLTHIDQDTCVNILSEFFEKKADISANLDIQQ